MELDELRVRLDVLDTRILTLLSERAQIVEEVAHFKRHHQLPIHIPERETAIVERLRQTNPGPLSGDALERIYRTIMEEMRNFEAQRVVCEPES